MAGSSRCRQGTGGESVPWTDLFEGISGKARNFETLEMKAFRGSPKPIRKPCWHYETDGYWFDPSRVHLKNRVFERCNLHVHQTQRALGAIRGLFSFAFGNAVRTKNCAGGNYNRTRTIDRPRITIPIIRFQFVMVA